MPSPAEISPRNVEISIPSNAIFGENAASTHTLSKDDAHAMVWGESEEWLG
jgi:hypothetical protein